MKTISHNKTIHKALLSHNEVQGFLEMAYLHHVSSIVSSPIKFSSYLQGKVLKITLDYAEQATSFTSRFLTRNPQNTPLEKYISPLTGATTHPISLLVI